MTIEEIVKAHYADLMWALTVKEFEMEKAQARIKELEDDKADNKASEE
jgi:hypothetical protein